MAEPANAQVAPKPERQVKVKLLNDVWVPDPAHPEGARRVRTNLPVLDEDGRPKFNKKLSAFVTEQVEVELPVSIAQTLVDDGKALRVDKL